MDGNSSLKLVDDTYRSGSTRPDQRTWRTDLFIPVEEVDKFKDEVQNAQKVSSGQCPILDCLLIHYAQKVTPVPPPPATSIGASVVAGGLAPPTSAASAQAAQPSKSGKRRKAKSGPPAPPLVPPSASNPPDAASAMEHDFQEIDGEDEEREWVNADVLHAQEPLESKSVCVERWRNAGPEARKKMFALFAVTGIFACLCRHGQVLVLCDMIRSGEL